MSLTKYTLQSSPLVHTPNLIRMLTERYRMGKKERQHSANILHSGYALPKETAHALLSGVIEYEVTEKGEVVFTVEEPTEEDSDT